MAPSVEESTRSRFIRLRGGFVLLLLHAVLGVASAFEPTPDAWVSTPADNSASDVYTYRLPTSVYPLHYDLEIQPYMNSPDPSTFTYRGSVKITVGCNIRTKRIVLHLNGPTVDPTSIAYYLEGSNIRQGYDLLKEDQKRQFLIITLDGYLQVGNNYTIEMNFTAPLQNKPVGFYYSSYQNGSETLYMMATQFHPIYARNAFPCFDEPAMKATFSVSIVRPSNSSSISNTPILNSTNEIVESGISYTRDVYQQTPRISTFALAFHISDYSYAANISLYKVLMKAWTKSQSLGDVNFILESGMEVNTYFGHLIKGVYLSAKQDFVGISEFELAAGWGLQFFKESQMLYNPVNYTEEDKLNVAQTVSYATAHEWFGNLVTPSWWRDVWLKEGLSGYYVSLGVTKIAPDFRWERSFIKDKLHEAFLHDDDFSSHPVYNEAHTPSAIKDMFDWVAYQKAPSLVRMMAFFVGKDIFRAGIKSYIEKYAFKTATTWDFLRVMDEEAKISKLNISVTEIMKTWLLQPNYPVVTVSRDFNIHSIIHVTQERFLADPTAKDPGTHVSPFNYLWSIPLTFTSSHHLNREQKFRDVYWMYKEERIKVINSTTPLPECTDHDGWIMTNYKQAGYYRVNYQSGNWLALSRQLKRGHTILQPIHRAQLISDAWNLAK